MTTTERDCAPDCAPSNSETEEAGANASARAGAREHTRPTAQSGAQYNPESALTARERFEVATASWLAQFSPPDIVTKDRPSLRKTWAYYRRGGWTVEDGAPRKAGMAFGWFVIVKKTLLYELDWVTDRPSTLAVATVLFVLLDQFPPLAWLIDVDKLPPLSWLI